MLHVLTLYSPATSSEIAEWIAERRANFPTKAKAEAKKSAAKAANGDAQKSNDARNAALEKQQQKAEKLRKQLEKVESSIKRKREQQDEGDDMRDVEVSSSPSSDSKSDDEKPEVMSARQEPSNPPPPRKADPTKHCKYYSTGGTCGKRGKCRFVHDATVREAALREREMNGGRMTLQQRLILNDKEQEDLTIVQSLKYLQDKGVLRKPPAQSSGTAASNAQSERTPATQTSTTSGVSNSLPPIPPRSVVSNDPASKYSGWNLSGFGNTGVKPGDL